MMVDFNKLDRTIHEKGRLSIMTLLASRSEWAFQDLKAALEMSDGNLITHLRALREAGFVSMNKEQNQRRTRSRTICSLTPDGRKAFEDYLAILEIIVEIGKQP